MIRLLGGFAVFASAFCFYFSTVVIRWSQAEVAIEPSYFVFARFLLGFVVVCAIMAYRRQPPRPRSYHLLLGRTLFNCVAVYCFYMAVKFTSVAEANILNMTYPVFVALISWALLRQQRDPIALAMVAVAFAGIWLILSPAKIDFKPANLWEAGFRPLSLLRNDLFECQPALSRHQYSSFFHVRCRCAADLCRLPRGLFPTGFTGILLPGIVLCHRCCRAVSADHWFSLCHRRGWKHHFLDANFAGRAARPFCGRRTSLRRNRMGGSDAPVRRQCHSGSPSRSAGIESKEPYQR